MQEAQKLPNRLGDAASILTNLGIGIVNSVFAAVTILILSIFMVGGGRRWIEQRLETQPPERAERIRRALDRSANAVGSYVGGVLVQATIAGLSTFVVLLILGVPVRRAAGRADRAARRHPARRRDDRRDPRRRS